MSVTSFDEIHEGREGSTELSQRGIVRELTRVWVAITNSAYDDDTVVLARAPLIGSPHPWQPGARLKRLKAVNDAKAKRRWTVTGTYTTERDKPGSDGGPGNTENPLADPAAIEWDTEGYRQPCAKDRDGKAIVNSAGDPPARFPEKDASRWVITIEKNVAAVPTWVVTGSYKDSVNSAQITIDGVTFAAETVKVSRIHIGRWECRNDIWYRRLHLTLHTKEETWREYMLDQGLRKKDGTDRVPCTNKDGSPVTHPVMLDGSGGQVANPAAASAQFINVDLYSTKDLSALPLS